MSKPRSCRTLWTLAALFKTRTPPRMERCRVCRSEGHSKLFLIPVPTRNRLVYACPSCATKASLEGGAS